MATTPRTTYQEALDALQAVTSPFDIKIQRRRLRDNVIEEIHYQMGVDISTVRNIAEFIWNISGGGHYLIWIYAQQDPRSPIAAFEIDIPGDEYLPARMRMAPGMPSGAAVSPWPGVGPSPFGMGPNPYGMTPGPYGPGPNIPQMAPFGAMPQFGGMSPYNPLGGMSPFPPFAAPVQERKGFDFDNIMAVMAMKLMTAEPPSGAKDAESTALRELREELRTIKNDPLKRELEELKAAMKAAPSREIQDLVKRVEELARERNNDPKESKELERIRRESQEAVGRLERAQAEERTRHAEERARWEAERRDQSHRQEMGKLEGAAKEREERLRADVARSLTSVSDAIKQMGSSDKGSAMWTAIGSMVPALLTSAKPDIAPLANMMAAAMQTNATTAQAQQAQQTSMTTEMIKVLGTSQKREDIPPWMITLLTREKDDSKQLTKMAEASSRVLATSMDVAAATMAQVVQMVMPTESPWVNLVRDGLNQIGAVGRALINTGGDEEEIVGQSALPPPPQQVIQRPVPQQRQAQARPVQQVRPANVNARPVLQPQVQTRVQPQEPEPPTRYYTHKIRQAIAGGVPAARLGRGCVEAYGILAAWDGLDENWAKLPEDPESVITWLAEPTGITQGDEWGLYLAAAVASARNAMAEDSVPASVTAPPSVPEPVAAPAPAPVPAPRTPPAPMPVQVEAPAVAAAPTPLVSEPIEIVSPEEVASLIDNLENMDEPGDEDVLTPEDIAAAAIPVSDIPKPQPAPTVSTS